MILNPTLGGVQDHHTDVQGTEWLGTSISGWWLQVGQRWHIPTASIFLLHICAVFKDSYKNSWGTDHMQPAVHKSGTLCQLCCDPQGTTNISSNYRYSRCICLTEAAVTSDSLLTVYKFVIHCCRYYYYYIIEIVQHQLQKNKKHWQYRYRLLSHTKEANATIFRKYKT